MLSWLLCSSQLQHNHYVLHKTTESRSQKRMLCEHILKYTIHNETMLALRYLQKQNKNTINTNLKQRGTHVRNYTAFAYTYIDHDDLTTLFSINSKHCWAFSLNECNKRCWCHQFKLQSVLQISFFCGNRALGEAMYRLLLLMCTHRCTLSDNFGTRWWIVIFACWDSWYSSVLHKGNIRAQTKFAAIWNKFQIHPRLILRTFAVKRLFNEARWCCITTDHRIFFPTNLAKRKIRTNSANYFSINLFF